jgi:hypothetical protein
MAASFFVLHDIRNNLNALRERAEELDRDRLREAYDRQAM